MADGAFTGPRHMLEYDCRDVPSETTLINLCSRCQLARTIPLLPSETYSLSTVGSVLATRSRNGRRRLYYYAVDDNGEVKPRTLWKARREDVLRPQPDAPRVTCMLPVELGHIILAYSKSIAASYGVRRCRIG